MTNDTNNQPNTNPEWIAGQKDTWKFYEDGFGKHRWERKARNGKVTNVSCEGFDTLEECEENAARHGFNKAKHEENQKNG